MSHVHLGDALRQIQRLFAGGVTTGLADSELLLRFERGGDGSAFSDLVARHGPMVLSVCRGVLRDEADAEDAFQATFLVLVRRAGSIRVDDSLGGWLHRVAYRTALRARGDAARRRSRERGGAVDEAEAPGGREADPRLSALHEEIARLPESYRRALVLCLLEGKTQAEAAEEIGCGEATVRRRLAGARERLRVRLDRRGKPLVFPPMPVVPPAWVASAVRSATAGRLAGPTVAPLVASVLAGMARDRARRVASSLIAVALLGTAGVAGFAASRPGPKPAEPVLLAPPLLVERPEPVVAEKAQGRVVGPDGKSVAGASVFLRGYGVRPPDWRASTDAEGRYRFGKAETHHEFKERLIAVAPGFGFGLASDDESTLKLVPDNPVVGRVINLEGRPIAGARVRVRNVYWPKSGDLGPWLEAVKRASYIEEFQVAEPKFLTPMVDSLGDIPGAHAPIFPPMTTDVDGRFRLVGLGKDRVAEIIIDGQGIASSLEIVVARPMKSIAIPAKAPTDKELTNTWDDLVVFGDVVDHVAGPTRVVEGVVTDRATGRPIAGLTVHGPWRSPLEYPEYDRFWSPTDALGRYRIEGLPVPSSGDLTIKPPEDQPYLGRAGEITIKPGFGPMKADITLRRGVLITGRVVDDETDEGLAYGPMHYYPFADNPTLRADLEANAAPEFEQVRTDDQGNFRIVGYPGRGIVTAWSGEHLTGVGADKIAGLDPDSRTQFYPPYQFRPPLANTLVEVNPPEGAEAITCELRLKKGKAREVLVVDPDGKPVIKFEASGLRNQIENPMTNISEDRFSVRNLIPGESREVVARLVSRKLMGMAPVTNDGEGPVTIRLQPWANLTGRLVDDEGRPRFKSVEIRLDDGKLPIHAVNGRGYDKPTFALDRDGRFRIEGLVPGARYSLGLEEGGNRFRGRLSGEIVLEPGETRDVGNLKHVPKAQ